MLPPHWHGGVSFTCWNLRSPFQLALGPANLKRWWPSDIPWWGGHLEGRGTRCEWCVTLQLKMPKVWSLKIATKDSQLKMQLKLGMVFCWSVWRSCFDDMKWSRGAFGFRLMSLCHGSALEDGGQLHKKSTSHGFWCEMLVAFPVFFSD